MRERITIFHLLTHSTGLPSMFEARPGMYIDVLADTIAAIVEVALPMEAAGLNVAYAPLFNHALLGEAVRRVDPRQRSYRDILHQDLFDPMGMKDTAMGVRRDLKARHLVPEFRGNYPIKHLGHSNLGPNGAFEEEHVEMPWVGGVSTAADMMRFAEMLRCEGTLDGQSIVSRAMVRHARTIWTADKPNEFYASGIRAAGGIAPPANMAWDSRCAVRRWAPACSGHWVRLAPSVPTARAPRSSGWIRSVTSASLLDDAPYEDHR